MVIFIQQVSHKFHQYRSSRPEVFYRKGVPRVCNFIKKETLAQVFSCEFCEISKNTFFHRTPPVAASVNKLNICQRTISISCFEFITLYQNILHDRLPTVSSDQIKCRDRSHKTILNFFLHVRSDLLDTGQKLNVHKMFRRRHGRLLKVLYSFN